MRRAATDAEILALLQHALGLDKFGRATEGGRSHFVACENSDDIQTCRAAASRGLMVEHAPSELSGGNPIFIVTSDGRKHVSVSSPKPPRMTPGQRRYRLWLDVADAFPDMQFGDWLRAGHGKAASP